MSKATKLKVMISSRCNDGFPVSTKKGGTSLTDIRRELKREIESQQLFGESAFEVWINEDAPPADASNDSWEECLRQVRDCDILIVLANGSAGWAKDGGGIGICHAEYMEGLNTARGKVLLIELLEAEPATGTQAKLNEGYRKYLSQQTAFRGGEVKTVLNLKARVRQALANAVVTLAQRGVKSAGSSRFDMGQALDWARMDFGERRKLMQATLHSSLVSRGAALKEDMVSLKIGKGLIAFVVHAIPASMGVAAARELTGRPFLRDHTRLSDMEAAVGPVHLIACHRAATETQAVSMLGFPDATVVSSEFGIYVADDVQKVQFVFLKNCRDESSLRHSQQRFFEWLDQTGESERLAKRATSRRKIIRAIATELAN